VNISPEDIQVISSTFGQLAGNVFDQAVWNSPQCSENVKRVTFNAAVLFTHFRSNLSHLADAVIQSDLHCIHPKTAW
jgi:hypothetical protein